MVNNASRRTITAALKMKPSLVATIAAQATPELMLCELIDNALEHTRRGQPTLVQITLNVDDDYLRVTNFNSSGITEQEARLLKTFGRDPGEKKTGSFSQEHGVGGMTSLYTMVHPVRGGLHILAPVRVNDSQGRFHGYDGYLRFDQPNWHANFDQPVEIVLMTDDDPSISQPEYRRAVFEINGLNPDFLRSFNPYKVADYLGLAYSDLMAPKIDHIKQPKLMIEFVFIDDKGTSHKIPIIPFVVNFNENDMEYAELQTWLDDHKLGPKVYVWFGAIDRELDKQHQNLRNEKYHPVDRHPETRMYAQILYLSTGRLVQASLFKDFSVPHATNKHSLDKYVAWVQVERHSSLRKTAFKDSFEAQDQTTQEVFKVVREFLGACLESRLQDAPEEDLTEVHSQVLEGAHQLASEALLDVFQRVDHLCDEFGLATTIIAASEQPQLFIQGSDPDALPHRGQRGKRRKTGGKKSLPGSGAIRGSREKTRVDIDGQELYEIGVTNPLPPVRITTGISHHLMGQVRTMPVDGEINSEMLIVEVNADNPTVKQVLSIANVNAALSVFENTVIEALLHALCDHRGTYQSVAERDLLVSEVLERVNLARDEQRKKKRSRRK